jgi:hypothetical protein
MKGNLKMATSKKNVKDVENNEANDQAEDEREDSKIYDAFVNAVEAEKSEDEVKMAMIQAGCPFKKVAKLYNDYLVEAGMANSKEERQALLDKTLGGKDLTDEKVFNKVVTTLIEKGKNINEKAAAAMVRGWAKKNDVECYTKPKGEGSGRTGFASLFYDWLLENPKCTKEEAADYIHGRKGNPETSDNVKKHESHYLAIANLVNKAAGGKK